MRKCFSDFRQVLIQLFRFVVPRHPEVEVRDVENHLRNQLARHKVARIEVEFVDSIPRNPSGKILRKILRAQAAEKRLMEM